MRPARCKPPRDRSIPLDYRGATRPFVPCLLVPPFPSFSSLAADIFYLSFLLSGVLRGNKLRANEPARADLRRRRFSFRGSFRGLNARRALASAHFHGQDDSLRKVITRRVEYFLNRVSRCFPRRRSQSSTQSQFHSSLPLVKSLLPGTSKMSLKYVEKIHYSLYVYSYIIFSLVVTLIMIYYT